MGRATRQRAGAVAALAALLLSSCGDPSPTPPPAFTPAPGATVVRGTERMAWEQGGNAFGLRFLAYIDNIPAELEGASCEWADPDARCSAPLPPLTDGVHTIALAAVSASGLEGERSAPLTVQKVPQTSAVSAATFPTARGARPGVGLQAVVTSKGGHSFTADVVARLATSTPQLAATPDGRLLVAGADGGVHVLHPGQAGRDEPALDARRFLHPPPIGPLTLAVHPDFSDNRFVFIAFLADDGPDDRTVLRVIRLRELADTLGEPSTLFEAPVSRTLKAAHVAVSDGHPETHDFALAGPRMAFGPDRLLYVLLPQGVELDAEPAASRPQPSMLRLDDRGRVPDTDPLSGITAHPLGMAWHPATGTLWLLAPGDAGSALAHPLTSAQVPQTLNATAASVRLTRSPGPSTEALTLQHADALALASVLAPAFDPGEVGPIRLNVPILDDGLIPGISGRIVDAVPGGDGTFYVAIADDGPSGTSTGTTVVRLRTHPR